MPGTYDDMFTQVGKVFKHMLATRTAQRTLAPITAAGTTGLREIINQFTLADMSMLSDIMNEDAVGDYGRAAMSALKRAAEKIIIETVDRNVPQEIKNITEALLEVAATMVEDSDSFDLNDASVVVAARAGNTGTGTVAVSLYGPMLTSRGQVLPAAQEIQFCRDEVWKVTCVADANSGLQPGNEQFEVRSERAFDGLDRRWRGGSGRTMRVNATSASVQQSRLIAQNVLRNSNFESSASNMATYWAARVGSAGTDIATTASSYDGSGAMRLIGGGTSNPGFYQLTNATSGTVVALKPDTLYIAWMFTRSNSGTVSKDVTLRIIDGSANNLCVSGVQTVTGSSHTTTYALTSGALLTNYNLPTSGVYFDITNTGTALAGGEEVYIDGVVLCEAARLAPGSAGIAIPAASTAFRNGDHFDLTFSNDDASDWAYWLDSAFGVYESGVVFPTDNGGSETIGDTRITS